MNEPISTLAARIASLSAAASHVLCGSYPAEPLERQNIAIDLMDCAGILATQLSEQAERTEQAAK
jgi:hypothetical protein